MATKRGTKIDKRSRDRQCRLFSRLP